MKLRSPRQREDLIMRREDLAAALRDRARRQGVGSGEVLDALDDDTIIESFVTCSGCGHTAFDTPEQLGHAIQHSVSVEAFLQASTHRH